MQPSVDYSLRLFMSITKQGLDQFIATSSKTSEFADNSIHYENTRSPNIYFNLTSPYLSRCIQMFIDKLFALKTENSNDLTAMLQVNCCDAAVIEQQCVTAVIKNQAQVLSRLDNIMNPINHNPVHKFIYPLWWQGWPSGESTCLPPMWPGFDFRTRCHMWIEFVGPLLCHERFFSGYSGFPLSSKTNI